MAELARTFTKAALSRITAGSEGARLVGSALSGVAGSTVQAMLEGLKTLVDGKLPSTSRGAAGGVGSLDENGKQPFSEINAAVLGGARRQGTWDASLGTAPAALANNDADRGKYWEVSVAGATLLGGKNDWNPGDWIIWEGPDWGWVDNTDRVGSVNGRTGAVTGLAEQNDARFTDARTPTDGSVTALKMAADNKAVIICTSTTRPASPVEGQHIYETDTDATLKNTGTPSAPAWSPLGGGGAPLKVYNVKEAPYGALGDGATDDRAALQAAIDAANAVGGGIVWLPLGTYVCSPVLHLKANVVLTGEKGARIKRANGTPDATPGLAQNAPTIQILNANGAEIRNLVIDGNVSGQGALLPVPDYPESRISVKVFDSHDVRILDVDFVNSVSDGIYLGQANPGGVATGIGCRRTTISGCSFVGNYDGRDGITFVAAQGVVVSDCQFLTTTRHDLPGSINLEPNSSSDFLRDILIDNCVVDCGATSNMRNGITLGNNPASPAPVRNLVISNCSVRGRVLRGIQLSSPPSVTSGVTVANCSIQNIIDTPGTAPFDALNAGIRCSQGIRALLAGNNIGAVEGFGIESAAAELAVKGGRIEGTASWGIHTNAAATDKMSVDGTDVVGCGNGVRAQGTGSSFRNVLIEGASTALLVQGGTLMSFDNLTLRGSTLRHLNVQTGPHLFGRIAMFGNGSSANAFANYAYPPTTETWELGDAIWNYGQGAAATNFWRCTARGTPGTWVAV